MFFKNIISIKVKNINKKCGGTMDETDNKNEINKKEIIKTIKKIIKICFWAFIIFCLGCYIYSEVAPVECEEGATLIDGECYSCPEGYEVNVEEKVCEKIAEENDNEEPTIENPEYSEFIVDMYKDSCKEYDYEEIFRYAESYEGEFAKFTGEVIQVLESDFYGMKTYQLRVNVTKTQYGYEDTIYVFYTPMQGMPRILEVDIVTVYGSLNGLETYTSVMNSTVTIPSILSQYIEIQ